MTDPTQPPYLPQQPSAPPYPLPPQQYAPQPGYAAQQGYPPHGYAPYRQQYAPPRQKPLSPALWIGLGAFVVAVVMTLVGDTTPILNAQTPLAIGFLAAVAAIAASIVTLLTIQRAFVWPALILAVSLLVAIWAVYDFYQAHEALAAVQQCFQDLFSC